MYTGMAATTSSGKLRTITGRQKLEQQQIASESVSPDCFKCGSSRKTAYLFAIALHVRRSRSVSR